MVAFPPVLVCTSLSLSIESSISGLQRCPLAAWKSSLPLSDACLECEPPFLLLCCVIYLDVESEFELKGKMHGHANVGCFNWAAAALSVPSKIFSASRFLHKSSTAKAFGLILLFRSNRATVFHPPATQAAIIWSPLSFCFDLRILM